MACAPAGRGASEEGFANASHPLLRFAHFSTLISMIMTQAHSAAAAPAIRVPNLPARVAGPSATKGKNETLRPYGRAASPAPPHQPSIWRRASASRFSFRFNPPAISSPAGAAAERGTAAKAKQAFCETIEKNRGDGNPVSSAPCTGTNYSITAVTAPEPTVLPPSRIAKRRPSSMAMGLMSSIFIVTWSPGMHISTPSGSVITPVTSVVRK